MLAFEHQVIWIRLLQESLSGFHHLFLGLQYFDTTPYYLIVMALIALLPRPTDLRYNLLFCVLFYSNHLLKHWFNLPRPGGLDPSLDLIQLATHYGFPSGAAMGSIIISALLWRHLKGVKGPIIASLYTFLICLSRLYLGVHFPMDILGGLGFGLLLWQGFKAYEHRYRPPQSWSTWAGAMLFGILIHPHWLSLNLALLATGLQLGSRLPARAGPITYRLAAFTLAGSLACFSLLFFHTPWLTAVAHLAAGLWLSASKILYRHLTLQEGQYA